MEELLRILTNYGFSVLVAVYLLVKMEKTISEHTKAVIALINKHEEGIVLIRELISKVNLLLERKKR